MIELRNRKCAEHYGEDVWASADASTKACFNFLCGNHTRNLPTVRFNKVQPLQLFNFSYSLTTTLTVDPVPNPFNLDLRQLATTGTWRRDEGGKSSLW